MTETTGMYEFLATVEDVIKHADPERRQALAETIGAYADDFPEEFSWAVGERAPTLLYQLMMTIWTACESEDGKTRKIRIVGLGARETEGAA